MIYVINFADEKFETQRKYNSMTALKIGKCDKVIEYSLEDIDKKYQSKFKHIFSYERGAGLWLWKPYIILNALNRVNENDYILYCDSGAFFCNKIQNLADVIEQNNIFMLTFEIPLIERQFTKKETFHLMNTTGYNTNQRLTGYILLKKCKDAVDFVSIWQKYMEDERILSYKKFIPDIKEFEDFYEHRDDQSVFSLLCHKFNIPAFRDPSQYGDRPWMYASSEYSFVPKQYNNSPYPKIIISNRKANPVFYKYKERLQTILCNLNTYYTQSQFFKRHKIIPKDINEVHVNI
jgi:hypothetical protein